MMRTTTYEGCPASIQPRDTEDRGIYGWRLSNSPRTHMWSVANSKSTLDVHFADSKTQCAGHGWEWGRRGCRPRPLLPAGLPQPVTWPPAVPVHSTFSVPSGLTPAATCNTQATETTGAVTRRRQGSLTQPEHSVTLRVPDSSQQSACAKEGVCRRLTVGQRVPSGARFFRRKKLLVGDSA